MAKKVMVGSAIIAVVAIACAATYEVPQESNETGSPGAPFVDALATGFVPASYDTQYSETKLWLALQRTSGH